MIGLIQPLLDFLGVSLSDLLLIIIVVITLRGKERKK